LDLKIRGISLELLKEAMAQSRVARIEILRTMLKTLPRPESNLSENAPRLLVTTINPEKIGMLIGPGGKNIRAIQEETNTVVEVSEDGRVTIAGADGNLAEAALKKVEACTATVQVGKIYDGTLARFTTVRSVASKTSVHSLRSCRVAMVCVTLVSCQTATLIASKTFAKLVMR